MSYIRHVKERWPESVIEKEWSGGYRACYFVVYNVPIGEWEWRICLGFGETEEEAWKDASFTVRYKLC